MRTALCLALLGVSARALPAQSPCGREAALEAYRTEILATRTTPAQLAWTGDAAACDPGAPSPLAVEHALRRVNYFRAAAGLGPVTVDAGWSAKAQAAALMMHAEGRSDHFPDTAYACYTDAGREAAGKSNLYVGRWGGDAVVGYVEDPGDNNAAVGHRRWILHPPKERIGLAFTDRADAMWVVGGAGPRPDTPDGVAWPPAGYVPAPLIFERWSFSRHRADFSSAAVAMTGPDGAPIALTQNEVTDGFADNTLVWEPDLGEAGVRRNPTEDLSYTVTVTGVVEGGEPTSYSYVVTAMAVDVEGCEGRIASGVADGLTAAAPRVGYRRATGELTFDGVSAGAGGFEATVFDELGRAVGGGRLAAGGTVAVGRLRRGVYLARLRAPDGRVSAATRFAVAE